MISMSTIDFNYYLYRLRDGGMEIFMKRKFLTIVLSGILCAGNSIIVNADNSNNTYFYCAAFYDQNDVLSGVKALNGKLTEDEINVLVDTYRPDGAKKARVFTWEEDMKPLDSCKKYEFYDDIKTINILHTNDMHGSLEGSGSVIGIDKISELKKDTNNAILVDGGDATQGVSLATLTHGEDIIDLMNMAGYDVMAAGNHEFDYGIEQLMKNVSLAKFPIISANTYYEGDPLFKTDKSNGMNCIVEIDGTKVGFFGLTTTDTKTSTNPSGIAGVTFNDEISTAKEQVQLLDAAGADAVIAIAHMGTNGNVECTSIQLAEAMAGTGLDAIIDGHSHTVVNTEVNGIVIAQTGTAEANVGRMSIEISDDGKVNIEENMLSCEFFKNIDADQEISNKIGEITGSQKEQLNKVVARTDTSLWGGYINNVAEARAYETNLGDLISDSMIYSTKQLLTDEYKNLPVAAIENGGGIRATISNGNVTMGDIINVLPFANTVMFKEVTPKILYDILEYSVSTVKNQNIDTGMLDAEYSGGFLQIGGMRFEYDPNAETNKILNLYLDDEETPLDRNDESRKIVLASNDYLIAGGNGYTMLAELKTIGEGGGLDQMLLDYINYITNNGTEAINIPVYDGRIRTKGKYIPKEYTAKIRVKNTDGNYAANTEITYYIDGEKRNGITDADGLLYITAFDGPHGIKLYEDQTEVYINNYSGAGMLEVDGNYPVYYPALTWDNEILSVQPIFNMMLA